ncbi:MAG: nucleoside-diphosphate kinase [Candidatus Parvarchaeota archaeon]|nr:hypothetical protein [Candidatus Parvarchaeota archaeon]
MIEKTLAFTKPDGTVRRYVSARFVKTFIDSGFSFLFFGQIKPDRKFIAEKHYGQYSDKYFYRSTIQYVASGPIVAMVMSGDDIVSKVREIIGPTMAEQAPMDTLRGRYGLYKGVNICHVSDKESAEKEVQMWMDEVLAVDESKDYNKLASDYVAKYIDYPMIDTMRYRELIRDMLDNKIKQEDLKVDMFSLLKKESDFDDDTLQTVVEGVMGNLLV